MMSRCAQHQVNSEKWIVNSAPGLATSQYTLPTTHCNDEGVA